MRIAWIGPVGDGGGVPSMGALLLESVLRSGAEVEYFTTASRDQLPEALQQISNLEVNRVDSRWQWGRWYSRTPMLSFLSGVWARTRAYNRLAYRLIEKHKSRPFDCIVQFSQSELFELGKHINELPPIVVYPCVHAAGELRWHRRESAYARQSERFWMHYLVRLFLMYRTFVQRKQFRRPAKVIGMSHRFNDLVARDYGLDRAKMDVLYHPIAMRSEPVDRDRGAQTPVKLLYVSRISVRKGLEQIVELSNRLADLAGQVEIEVIGARTQWSDYTAHLRNLNSKVARYVGSVSFAGMSAAYDGADVLLVPSLYEPGGLVVGEALSRGVCVVASDEVGSAEPVGAECCRKFAAGDIDAFERETRQLIRELSGPSSGALRRRARAEAVLHFDPPKIGNDLISILTDVTTSAASHAAGRRAARSVVAASEHAAPI